MARDRGEVAARGPAQASVAKKLPTQVRSFVFHLASYLPVYSSTRLRFYDSTFYCRRAGVCREKDTDVTLVCIRRYPPLCALYHSCLYPSVPSCTNSTIFLSVPVGISVCRTLPTTVDGSAFPTPLPLARADAGRRRRQDELRRGRAAGPLISFFSSPYYARTHSWGTYVAAMGPLSSAPRAPLARPCRIE